LLIKMGNCKSVQRFEHTSKLHLCKLFQTRLRPRIINDANLELTDQGSGMNKPQTMPAVNHRAALKPRVSAPQIPSEISTSSPGHTTIRIPEEAGATRGLLQSFLQLLFAAVPIILGHILAIPESFLYSWTLEIIFAMILVFDNVKEGKHTAHRRIRWAGSKRNVGSKRVIPGIAKMRMPLALILTAALIGPASALDNEIALQPYAGASTMMPDPNIRFPIGLVGTYALIATGLLTTTTKNLLGPLMGISSVLWFIMRNDAAIKPSASWS
jgi:hypothetical protein